MTQYISKSVLVAEIERMKVDAIQFPFEEYGTVGTCNKLLSFLDTLEVKEVDLEKEIGLFTTKELLKKRNHSTGVYHFTQNDIDNIARHFFELGLKAKGE